MATWRGHAGVLRMLLASATDSHLLNVCVGAPLHIAARAAMRRSCCCCWLGVPTRTASTKMATLHCMGPHEGGTPTPVLSLSRHESFGLLANVGYTDAIQPTLTMLAPPERESAQGQSLGGAERCLGLPAMLETLLNLSP